MWLPCGWWDSGRLWSQWNLQESLGLWHDRRLETLWENDGCISIQLVVSPGYTWLHHAKQDHLWQFYNHFNPFHSEISHFIHFIHFIQETKNFGEAKEVQTSSVSCALMHQLVEGVLSIGSWLPKIDSTRRHLGHSQPVCTGPAGPFGTRIHKDRFWQLSSAFRASASNALRTLPRSRTLFAIHLNSLSSSLKYG